MKSVRGLMFVLTMLVYIGGLLDNPSIITHEFKSRASCEAAAQALEERLEAEQFRIVWQCDAK